jgi:hypothetical protein
MMARLALRKLQPYDACLVKPFVKRQKSNVADAKATAEATARSTMPFVAVKSVGPNTHKRSRIF